MILAPVLLFPSDPQLCAISHILGVLQVGLQTRKLSRDTQVFAHLLSMDLVAPDLSDLTKGHFLEFTGPGGDLGGGGGRVCFPDLLITALKHIV